MIYRPFNVSYIAHFDLLLVDISHIMSRLNFIFGSLRPQCGTTNPSFRAYLYTKTFIIMMTSYLIAIGISFFVSAIISLFWVRGIDYMHKNHADYKGEDFLNWGDETAP